MFKNIFIGGNIKIRVCRVVVNTKHGVVCANVGDNISNTPAGAGRSNAVVRLQICCFDSSHTLAQVCSSDGVR